MMKTDIVSKLQNMVVLKGDKGQEIKDKNQIRVTVGIVGEEQLSILGQGRSVGLLEKVMSGQKLEGGEITGDTDVWRWIILGRKNTQRGCQEHATTFEKV